MNIKEIEIPSDYKYAMVTTDPLFEGDWPRVKETIDVDPATAAKLKMIVPKENEHVSEGGFDRAEIRGDIIISGTIPTPDIEIDFTRCIVDNPANVRVTGQICVETREGVMTMLKTVLGTDNPAPVGFIKLTTTDKHGTLNFTFSIRMYPNGKIDWIPIVRVDKKVYSSTNATLGEIIAQVTDVRDTIFLTWYGIQIALLNPVIAERFRRETVPVEQKKTNNRTKKKQPKRYVKKLILGDISDLEFSKEKKPHQIHEPFWWVSGHWRQYSSGKRIFIQGYWKGPFKEYGNYIKGDPREREIVIE